MSREGIWYLFGLAALALIVLRLRSTQRANLRDPVVLSFTLGLFLGAFGNLSKQAVLAEIIDRGLGLNAAWLIADSLFLAGLCAGTYWVDLMSQPELRRQGGRLLVRPRTGALLLVIGWMITAAVLAGPVWGSLERGGIDVGGQPLLLSARLAYFAYSLWSLSYLSYHFYRQRQHMRDRFNYVRLTIPWAGITLALAAPALQVVGLVIVFIRPASLASLWPPLWGLISVIQAGVALLIIATFFGPAYRFVSWLDKQILIHRLRRVRHTLTRSWPDLAPDPNVPGPFKLIVRDPDRWLATVVNELEMAKQLMGRITYQIEAPAGGVMPDTARYALQEDQTQFLRGLTGQTPVAGPHVVGDTYALARWYAAVGNAL